MVEKVEKIRVIIVEDDAEIRQLLYLLVSKSEHFQCVGQFSNCEDSIAPILESKPDVVLMDIELPGMSGIEGVTKIRELGDDTDFIMLTIRDDDDSIFESLRAGATGYLLKDTPPGTLLKAIKEVYNGGSPITPSIARRVTQSFHPSSTSPLSERETQVLEELCNGKNYNHIAEKFFISGHTVRAHIKNIYKKLHVNSRGEAVSKALRKRIV
jgi:DNA-binding NarL/FixJ family response regulator